MIPSMPRAPRIMSGRFRLCPSLDEPVVTSALIGLCALVFLIGPASGFTEIHGTGTPLQEAQRAYFRQWGVMPDQLWNGGWRAWTTPITAMFLHGTWFHLAGNLLFLLVFGRMVEQRVGRAHFLAFYLASGYLAMLSYAAAHPDSSETLVGASGAISAVLGAFLYLFPRARVTSVYPFLFFLPLRLPAWLVLLFWVTLQSLALRADAQGPGIAHLAHVTGFALGFLYAWAVFSHRTRVSTPAQATEGESKP